MPKDTLKLPTRGAQLSTSGLGKVFTTPQKRRDKKKSTTFVAPLALDMRQQHLLQKMEQLKAHQTRKPAVDVLDIVIDEGGKESFISQDATLETPDNEDTLDGQGSAWVDEETIVSPPAVTFKRHRILPDATANQLYARWMAALPRLVPFLASYITRTMGVPLEPLIDIKSSCLDSKMCLRKSTNILCLFVDCKSSVLFTQTPVAHSYFL